MTAKRVVIVGNGRMAQACASLLLRDGTSSLRLVVAEGRSDAAAARLAGFCRKADIPILQPSSSINASEVVAAIAGESPDLILSVDNFQIFGPALLATARGGCINFHNGPIDRYRGVNVPSWAIFNGESTHGITWHYMERAVDAGDIVAERRFALTGEETALSLTLECVAVGLAAFEDHLRRILGGERTARPAGPATHYRRGELPDGGRLSLHSSAAHIGRLLRAMDFRPLPNPFAYARLSTPSGDLIVNAAHPIAPRGAHAPGEIVRTDSDLVLACADQLLAVDALMLRADEPANVSDAVAALGLRAGQRLT